DHSLRYYEYGFWWSSSSVRFFICIDGEEKELWNFERSDLIPTNYSNIIVNLWHNDVHWDNGTKANPPSVDCVLKIDWIEYKDFKKPIELKKEYILNLREPDKSIINFGKVREVKICDINGRLIKTLFQHSEYLAETSCEEKIWDGKDLRGRIVKSGVYIYQIENNGEIFTGKILVIK
ncbi:MAG: hypothetical protein N2712_07730, partial [Brevinematales bacterium]|nr:hypothetical protein [Brevinematales bacterium]